MWVCLGYYFQIGKWNMTPKKIITLIREVKAHGITHPYVIVTLHGTMCEAFIINSRKYRYNIMYYITAQDKQ